MTRSILQCFRARLHLDQGNAGLPGFHRDGEAMTDFTAPTARAEPIVSHTRRNIAMLCPDLVHEAELGLQRRL